MRRREKREGKGWICEREGGGETRAREEGRQGKGG